MSRAKLQYVGDLISRLKQHLQVETDAQLAESLGLSRNAISVWRHRENVDLPLIITKCSDLNLHWLITGVGEASAPESTGVSETEATLLEQLRAYGWDTLELLSYLVELHALMHRYGRKVDVQSLGSFLTEREEIESRTGQSRPKMAAEPGAKYK